MKTLLKKLLLVTGLGLVALLTSCQAPATHAHTPTSAVSCAKCGTVSFLAPSTSAAAGGKGYVTLRSSRKMTCPDCDNKVIVWAKTGTFTEHVCKTCGGAMKHCTQY